MGFQENLLLWFPDLQRKYHLLFSSFGNYMIWNDISHSFVGLQLCVLQPKVVKSEEEAPSLGALIKDPYILIAAGLSTTF